MTLVSIGVDHATAPVEVREALAFDPDAARAFLREGAASFPERVLLSTCNRTELIAVPASGVEAPEAVLLSCLERARGMRLADAGVRPTVRRSEEAVRHLVRVACGVESMVLGEAQILGQVKEAGELAESCGAAGPILRRVLQTAYRVAKRARSETSIGEGAVSVASASVDLARRVFGELTDRKALVVGAGETGRLVAHHLHGAGVGSLLVANRTIGRARIVAEEVDGQPWGLCGVPPGLREADIVICSTRSETPILTHAELKAAMRVRKGRMLLVLDIAVPRDVESAAAKLSGLFLHDIDALTSIVDGNLEVRRQAVPEIEAMVDEAVRGFAAWERGLEVVPCIKALRARFDAVRNEELERNLRRIPEEARAQAERLTESLLRRLLHTPIERLRASASDGSEGRRLTAAIREIFGLSEEEGDE